MTQSMPRLSPVCPYHKVLIKLKCNDRCCKMLKGQISSGLLLGPALEQKWRHWEKPRTTFLPVWVIAAFLSYILVSLDSRNFRGWGCFHDLEEKAYWTIFFHFLSTCTMKDVMFWKHNMVNGKHYFPLKILFFSLLLIASCICIIKHEKFVSLHLLVWRTSHSCVRGQLSLPFYKWQNRGFGKVKQLI